MSSLIQPHGSQINRRSYIVGSSPYQRAINFREESTELVQSMEIGHQRWIIKRNRFFTEMTTFMTDIIEPLINLILQYHGPFLISTTWHPIQWS
jgi:hypothetical protein